MSSTNIGFDKVFRGGQTFSITHTKKKKKKTINQCASINYVIIDGSDKAQPNGPISQFTQIISNHCHFYQNTHKHANSARSVIMCRDQGSLAK